MSDIGRQKIQALLVGGDGDVHRTIAHYLRLHGMDAVEAHSMEEAERWLGRPDSEPFGLVVAQILNPAHADWPRWKSLVTRRPGIPLLVHGTHFEEWDRVQDQIGRGAGFLGKPFNLADFHWVLQQLR